MQSRLWDTLCRWPYRFLAAAALIALLLCLLPVQADAPERQTAQENAQPQGIATGADLSERTGSGCLLHQTLWYAPCGHSVQRRAALPAALVGLSRAALTAQLPAALPGATLTGFSAQEVDVSVQLSIPCPLHWVLRTGRDGCLAVLQNRSGDALETVRTTGLRADSLSEDAQAELAEGLLFDDVQMLEGYLESLCS